MDDLQRDGAPYDEEMLFDFGIAEDDETINSLPDGFSDAEFDGFSDGMEVYNNSVQTSLKTSNLSKSPVITSGILLNQRSALMRHATHPQLPSDISDDDDSNQIMVSMNIRRSSQEWDAVQLFTQPVKQEPTIESTVLVKEEKPCGDENSNFQAKQLIANSASEHCANGEPQVKADITISGSDHPEKNLSVKEMSPTRRSSRVVKSPAWLEDSSKIPLKRQRK